MDYQTANDAYYRALNSCKKEKGKDYKDDTPSDAIKNTINDMISSVKGISDAENLSAIARKHKHLVSEAEAKEYELKQARKSIGETIRSFF